MPCCHGRLHLLDSHSRALQSSKATIRCAHQRPNHTHTRASLRQSDSASLTARHNAHYPFSPSFSCFVVAQSAVNYSYRVLQLLLRRPKPNKSVEAYTGNHADRRGDRTSLSLIQPRYETKADGDAFNA